MNHDEMLRKLGLTEAQYRDLMDKFLKFCQGLDEDQKKLVRHNLPSLEQAAKSFGPDVSVEDFKKFVGEKIIICGLGCMGGHNQQ
jgi:hypothetical protein